MALRIRELRRLKKKTLDELGAEIGMSAGQLSKVETGGRRVSTDWLAKIAKALDVSLADLVAGDGFPIATNNHSELKDLPKFAPSPYAAVSKRDLPVRGGVMGGRGGVFLDNGEVLDWVMRPSSLEGVKDAYAVYVFGDSMEPRYFAGEILHVHPNKPVTTGAFVVVQLHPEKPGGELEYLIKRFVRQDAKRVVVEEYCPEKRKFDIPASRVIAIHRVVGTHEG